MYFGEIARYSKLCVCLFVFIYTRSFYLYNSPRRQLLLFPTFYSLFLLPTSSGVTRLASHGVRAKARACHTAGGLTATVYPRAISHVHGIVSFGHLHIVNVLFSVTKAWVNVAAGEFGGQTVL